MPPPTLPPAANLLATVVYEEIDRIRRRAGTGFVCTSRSDVTRGVHDAITARGLLVLDDGIAKAITDEAHGLINAPNDGHVYGFCLACADLYAAVNRAIIAAKDALTPVGLPTDDDRANEPTNTLGGQ